MKTRCSWSEGNQLYQDYHDFEWGVPVHDDLKLFEFLILEGMQAGLSWLTILKKRDNFKAAFDNFNPEKIACYDQSKIDSLMQDKGIIRNKLKITAAIKNAQGYLKIVSEYGSFDKYIWQFVDGQPIINHWKEMQAIPAKTDLAERMSKDLKSRGFNFVGPTICYAFMQAVGMVNDHVIGCFRYTELCK